MDNDVKAGLGVDLDTASRAERICILIPIYNDWAPLSLLLNRLETALSDSGIRVSVFIVDDGSTEPGPLPLEIQERSPAIEEIHVIRLVANLGNQHAVCVSLIYLAGQEAWDAVLLMDGDGEDSPGDVPVLIEKWRSNREHIVVATRTDRAEGPLFRLFYALYKILFKALTGHNVNFGNFSVLPVKLLKRLIHSPELWTHLPAAIIRAGLPICPLPAVRGKRLGGRSHMAFTSLIMHGLAGISVFADRALARILTVFAILLAITGLGISTVVAIRLFTDLAAPGWASMVSGSLTIIFVQVVMTVLVVLFLMMKNLSSPAFIPSRYALDCISEVEPLYPDE